MLYGNGRAGEACLSCLTPAHLMVDGLIARRIASVLVTLTIGNAFNDRYLLTAGESDERRSAAAARSADGGSSA